MTFCLQWIAEDEANGSIPGQLNDFQERNPECHLVSMMMCPRNPGETQRYKAVWGRSTRPEARRVVGRYDDSNRLEWVCERLSEHSMYLQHYKHAHELPRGGFALYTNSTLLGYGECIADAIDDAIKKSEATPSPQLAKEKP